MKFKNQETPHWIFWITGGSIVVIAVLTNIIEGKIWQIISDVALNIGISIIAVSVIDWIWRRMGGDPLMNAINELRATTALLADLHETGIKRVFLSREAASERKRDIREKMKTAAEVDMMGISLRSGWSSTPEFQEILKKRAVKGLTKFRILVFDPDKSVTGQRALEEDGQPSNRIAETSAKTLSTILMIKNNLPESDRDAIKIKVVQETNMYCSIIRVDDFMLVTKYLMHLSGSNSETIEIAGKDSTYFKIYENEFNAMWDHAASWPH
jgi:hypothetical protein